MVRKKIITYDYYSECYNLKFGANALNTKYTIGGKGTVYNLGDNDELDIIYQSVVIIKEGKIWMRGEFLPMGGDVEDDWYEE